MELSVHAFTPPELQRLIAYRAAVRAGFYTDVLTRQPRAPRIGPYAAHSRIAQSPERR
jgi:hypothetical protein